MLSRFSSAVRAGISIVASGVLVVTPVSISFEEMPESTKVQRTVLEQSILNYIKKVGEVRNRANSNAAVARAGSQLPPHAVLTGIAAHKPGSKFTRVEIRRLTQRWLSPRGSLLSIFGGGRNGTR